MVARLVRDHLNAERPHVDVIVHALIEIRQAVSVRPTFDLARVTLRSTIAVRSPAIPFLQPLLIFPLEFVIESDAMDVGALLATALFFAKIGSRRCVFQQMASALR